MKVQRIECKSCGCIRQEKIHFVTGKRSYTNKFARYVVDLSRIGTIKDVALFLNISWDTVKDIQKRYLQRHYGNPDLSKLEYIGIDEFAVRKGHVYKTIVADLLTGQVVYVGDGKGADALDRFWKKARKAKAAIKAVATDLSTAFISSVRENAPDATLVFDHFHVVKLMNDTLDKLRRQAYNLEADLMKRKVLKGTRWLLLCNGADIYDSCHRNRLENALEMNAPLMKGYYLKESLREIWMQVTKEQAQQVLMNWVEQAQDSKVPLLQKFAMTLMAHRSGILSWYDHHISTGKLEGINNKIKTMKRQAYGYRDEKFFFHLTSSINADDKPFFSKDSIGEDALCFAKEGCLVFDSSAEVSDTKLAYLCIACQGCCLQSCGVSCLLCPKCPIMHISGFVIKQIHTFDNLLQLRQVDSV